MHKLKGSLCVALMLGSIVLARALEPNDPDLVGLWLFDDGSGDVATDSSGNGNDATLNGDFEWIDGAFGGGILSKGGRKH
ncbi:MAG: hypothetical protein KatS3mg115_2645 [Candidatus Poribacteria bacterium]|nr:MAG: hypothetical protein KatS3mg115_2645 [Candidatus Poribacteria bacterium]